MEPGILSGAPAFDQPVHFIRPTLPELDEIRAPLAAALASGQLTNDGPNVRLLEARLAEYLGAHCVCVGSGTLALYLAACCLLPGRRSRVLVPAFTFPATALAFAMAGAEVVLADVTAGSWCLDEDAVGAALLGGSDVLVPVNVFGTPPAAERLDALAAAAGRLVIYDSAHGLGSERRGRKVGTFGNAEAFSLHATKILACGEGGVVATGDESLAREIRKRRNFGLEEQVSRCPGTNAKMPEFSAILGLWGLARLESWIARRARLAELYRARLGALPGLSLQVTDPGDRSNHVNFPVRVDAGFGLGRDELLAALAAENVFARAYFGRELSAHPGLAVTALPGLPPPVRAREIGDRVLCLPIYSHQEEDEVSRICDAICCIHEAASRIRKALRAPAAEEVR